MGQVQCEEWILEELGEVEEWRLNLIFLRNDHTDFDSDYINLHSHKPGISVLLTPQLQKHVVVVVMLSFVFCFLFFILAILTGLR